MIAVRSKERYFKLLWNKKVLIYTIDKGDNSQSWCWPILYSAAVCRREHARSCPYPLPRCFCIVRLFSYQRFKYFHFWLNISAQDKTYNLDFFEQLSKSMSVATDKNTDKNITGTVKWIYSQNRKMCIFEGISTSISLPVFQVELFIHGTVPWNTTWYNKTPFL